MLCQAEKSGVLRSSARGSGSGFLRHILGVLISSARSSATGEAVGPARWLCRNTRLRSTSIAGHARFGVR